MRAFRRLPGEKYIYVLAKTVEMARTKGGEHRTYDKVTECFPYEGCPYAMDPTIWWAFTGQKMPAENQISDYNNRYRNREAGIVLTRITVDDVPFPGKFNHLQSHFLPEFLGTPIMVRHRIWTSKAWARSQDILAGFNRTHDPVAALYEQGKREARAASRPMRAHSSRRVKRGFRLKNLLPIAVILVVASLIIGAGWQVFAAVQDGRITLFEDEVPAAAATAPPGGSETWTPQAVPATPVPEPTAIPEQPAAAPPAVGGSSQATQIQMRTRLPVQVALKTSSGRDIVVSLVVYLEGDRVKGDMLVGGTAVPVDKRIRESDDQNSEEFFLYLPPDEGNPNPTRLGYFQVARSETRATVFFTVAPE